MPQLTYQSAERYILSREFFGMKLGLENITSFLEEIGNPQHNYKTIHISGTNGKGSTSAMLDSILRQQGYKTGLFTSPHLTSLRERMQVNGRIIPRQSVLSFIKQHKKRLSERKLSFFELITAMAFDYFSKAKVDIAVIETGLGGRLDASNVLKPVLTITTEISRDHVEILGRTLPKIAGEKAGIIKAGVPHLIGLIPENTVKVFEKRCGELKSDLYRLSLEDFVPYFDTMKFDFNQNGFSFKKLNTSLVGTHQINNAALTVKAVSILKNYKVRVSRKAVRDGLRKTSWPGRFQLINYKSKPTHILDVSHNASGINTFVDSFQKLYPGRKAHILTGFVKRKEHKKMFSSLNKIASSFSLVPLSTKRTINIDDLTAQINFNNIPYKKFGSLSTAYGKLLKKTNPDDIVIIIGSHYLVGEFMNKFKIK